MTLNMRSERVRRGMSAQDVADATGFSVNSILKWEIGKTNPLATNVIKLAELYGCSVDYLLGVTDKRKTVAVPLDRAIK